MSTSYLKNNSATTKEDITSKKFSSLPIHSNGHFIQKMNSFNQSFDDDWDSRESEENKEWNERGRPLQVVVAKDDHSFDLNEELLSQILLNPEIKDKKVMVLSVAGAFRKGKSFFLDFCLRYLLSNGSSDWLGTESSPLDGFPWRGGAERNTTGILMWSKPFIVTHPDTLEEIAVLLMDTQGAFDSISTVKECATIFALSQLLSSVQVFNIMLNVQEDDLQHLQLFTEYGRLAMEDNNYKPFQDLHFFVRDWQYPYEHEYGADGGLQLINKRLQIREGQPPELEQLRKHIKSCFRNIGCYLMPHPGLKVATNPNFDGRLSDITDEFKEHLKLFIPVLLAPSNLVVKQINGSKITCKQLLQYFKAYIKMYQGDEIPQPKSMLIATAEANNLNAVSTSKDYYIKEMEQICGSDKPFINEEILTIQHQKIKKSSLKMFDLCKKMGGEDFSTPFREKLEKDITNIFDNFLKQNQGKNIFSAIKTPAVLLTVIMCLYFISSIFNIIYMFTFTRICSLIILFFFFLLFLWTYSRYTGDMRELAEVIDDLVLSLWDGLLGPFVMKVMQGSNQQMLQQSAAAAALQQFN